MNLINIGDTVKYIRPIPGYIDKDIFEVVEHDGGICLRETSKGYYLGDVTWGRVRSV